MQRLLLVSALALFVQSGIAQDLYKYHGDNTDLPVWAQLMYQESPDPHQVIAAYESYFSQHRFRKSSHTQYFKRWLRGISRAHATNGTQPWDQRHLRKWNEAGNQNAQRAITANWTSIGPFDWDHDAVDKSYAPGAAHIYSVEQAASDPDILYAATATTGIWKSSDHGDNWFNLTHGLLVNGTSALEINHVTADVVFAEMLAGIYKTINGGTSWTATGDAVFQSINLNTRDLMMHPADTQFVLAATNAGLYKTINGGNDWTLVLDGDVLETEFHPTDPDTIYAVRNVGDATEFFRSVDGGTTFTMYTSGWPAPDIGTGEHQRRTELAVTPNAPDMVYALATGSANGGSGLYGVYISNDAGVTWQFQCCGPQPAGPPSSTNQNLMGWSDQGTDDGGQYYYDLAFDVSPTHADSIFVAGVNLWVSDDGGVSFVCPAKWSHSYKPNYVHADIHDVHYYNNTGEIWIACDGGIFFSDDNGDNFTRKMNGITGTDFWGFGMGHWKGDVMLGGTYHNGTLLKDHDVYLNGWISTDGGDNYRGFVHPTMDRMAFSDYNIKTLSGDRLVPNETRPFNHKPNATYTVGASSDILFHPAYEGTWWTGSGTTLWKTENNGYTFDPVHDFGEDLAALTISFTNPDVIYVTTFPGWWDAKHVYRTTDGGITWTDITPSSAQLSGNIWVPYDIEVSHTDPDKIWILRTSMYGGTNLNGVAVFSSDDGGTTWTNITSPVLDGYAFTSLMHQYGTDNGLYIGTRHGVFYRDDFLPDWTMYSTGLPASVHIVRMMPFYRDNTLRAASNRSVWESAFHTVSHPVAQAAVWGDTHACPSDTVYFKDRSILSESGATWQWSFPGGTPSSSAERNPKVLYGSPGAYDVELTVTDIHGTSTRMFPGLIEVIDGCALDTIPGKAFACSVSPDQVIIEPFDITTNTFSISAWVYPDGIQNDYSGIVMNDGTAAGFNFREGNNTLGYHWPGGQWWWDSGLVIHPGRWAYVAMVVTPSEVRLYVNGEVATHAISVSPADIGQMRIGSYQGWAGRNFAGIIDEVRIWNRALTTEEVRLNRHLIKDPANDVDLIGYYQFNSPGSTVYNKAGVQDGIMAGNAQKISSHIPVGPGVSEFLHINAPGMHEFTDAGIGLRFSSGIPDGDVYATRLNIPPDTFPADAVSLDRGYWIVNNYGQEQVVSPDSIWMSQVAFVSEAMSSLPASLLSRGDNTVQNDWLTNTSGGMMYEGLSGAVSFGPGNNTTRLRQFAISRDSFPFGKPSVIVRPEGSYLDTLRGGSSVQLGVLGQDRGIVIPVITDAELNGAGSPIEGLIGFHANDKRIVYFNGSEWREVAMQFADYPSSCTALSAEGLSIGADSVASSAAVQLGNQGFLLPARIPLAELTSVDYPAAGLIFVDTTVHQLLVYNGTTWMAMKNISSGVVTSDAEPVSPGGVAIGSAEKDPNAILEMVSLDRSIALPVIPVTDVCSPVEGLAVFDPDHGTVCVYDGQYWYRVQLQ